jgi:hypothetical protein
MRALAGRARQFVEHRRGETGHFDLVEGAGGEREQWAADAVALGILHLPHIAERHHRLDQMEGRGIVQADALAQLGKADAVAVPGDFLDDGKGAADRLHAAGRARGGVFAGLMDGGDAGRRRAAGCGFAFGCCGHRTSLLSLRLVAQSGPPYSAFLRLR